MIPMKSRNTSRGKHSMFWIFVISCVVTVENLNQSILLCQSAEEGEYGLCLGDGGVGSGMRPEKK